MPLLLREPYLVDYFLSSSRLPSFLYYVVYVLECVKSICSSNKTDLLEKFLIVHLYYFHWIQARSKKLVALSRSSSSVPGQSMGYWGQGLGGRGVGRNLVGNLMHPYEKGSFWLPLREGHKHLFGGNGVAANLLILPSVRQGRLTSMVLQKISSEIIWTWTGSGGHSVNSWSKPALASWSLDLKNFHFSTQSGFQEENPPLIKEQKEKRLKFWADTFCVVCSLIIPNTSNYYLQFLIYYNYNS